MGWMTKPCGTPSLRRNQSSGVFESAVSDSNKGGNNRTHLRRRVVAWLPFRAVHSVVVDSWLPCKDPARLKGKEKGLDHLPAFAKAFNNQIWPCIVEKVRKEIFHCVSFRERITLVGCPR